MGAQCGELLEGQRKDRNPKLREGELRGQMEIRERTKRSPAARKR